MVKYILKQPIIWSRNFLLRYAGVSETAYPEKWGSWRHFILRILGVSHTSSLLLAEPHHFEQAGVKDHIVRMIPTDPAEGPVHTTNPLDATDGHSYFWFPRFTYELGNAVFDPLTGLVLLNSVVVTESSFRFPTPELYDLNVIKRCKSPIKLDVPICSGLQWAFNYHHWLTEGLISVLRIQKEFGKKIPFVTPAKLSRYQTEALQLLGIECIRIDGPVLCNRFLLAGQHQRSQAAPRPSDIKMLRDTFIPLALKQNDSEEEMIDIYISRSRASRSLKEEKLLESLIRDYGFQVVFTEDLAFGEEIALFARARTVIGITGSGLANHLWMKPGGNLIEIKLTQYHDPSFQYTCPLLGLGYSLIDFREHSLETPANVVMEKIDKHLNTLLGSLKHKVMPQN